LWERSQDAAGNFAATYEATILRLRDVPGIGVSIGEDERRVHLAGWPYSIIYRLDGPIVNVVALAHASRRPGYWRDSL
jgi:hypothetical protein